MNSLGRHGEAGAGSASDQAWREGDQTIPTEHSP